MIEPHDRDPRLVEDDNVFWSGHTFHAISDTGKPIEFSTRRACRVVLNACPAPDASCQRGTVTAGGRSGHPSQDWQAGETMALYDAADLALVKHDHCKRAKASAYKATKARKAVNMQPQPLARCTPTSGPATVELPAGTYVVASSAKLPFSVFIKALPPASPRPNWSA